MHGIGITEALTGLPDWVAVLFALVTQLGDAWFLFGAVSLGYWYADEGFADDPRRTGATLVALGVCALATTIALKSLFGVHRPGGAGEAVPPGWLPALFDAVYVSISTGDGYGFPSGHATGATIVYGGAALLYDRLGPSRDRLLGAVAVVGLVTLSRLVIGVHHLPDVLAGVVIGLIVLFGTLRLAEQRPDRAFLVAGGISAVALVVALSGGHAEEASKAAIGIGAAVGGGLEWWRYGDAERVRVPTGGVLLGLPVLGGFWGAVYAAELALPLSALGSAIAVGGIVAMPRLVGWWNERNTTNTGPAGV
jgi:membrane-associated phospholipid phosphatase